MPTEQERGRPRLNSDIYALGMIGIQALTGLNPRQLLEDVDTGEIIWHQAMVNPGWRVSQQDGLLPLQRPLPVSDRSTASYSPSPLYRTYSTQSHNSIPNTATTSCYRTSNRYSGAGQHPSFPGNSSSPTGLTQMMLLFLPPQTKLLC